MIEIYFAVGIIFGIGILWLSHEQDFMKEFPEISQWWKIFTALLIIPFWPLFLLDFFMWYKRNE